MCGDQLCKSPHWINNRHGSCPCVAGFMSREGRMTRLISYGCIAIAVALAQLTGPAAAQDNFPSRPIKLVVPLAAGGGIDFTARATAQRLSEVIGQQVVVENLGGGGRHDRRQHGGARRARRLHAALSFGDRRGQRGGRQGFAVRLAARPRAGLAGHALCAGADDQSVAARQGPQGIHRARQGQSRQVQLRLVRRRDGDPSRQRAVQGRPPASTSCTCRIAATPA